MANYYGQWRTNYFQVKDPDAFRKELEDRYGSLIEIVKGEGKHPGKFALLVGKGSDSGAIPTTLDVDESVNEEGFIDVDLPADVSKHLVKGEVAVFMESGSEKLRYLIGYAIAVNHEGKQVGLSIGDIYRKAAKKFKVPLESILHAEY